MDSVVPSPAEGVVPARAGEDKRGHVSADEGPSASRKVEELFPEPEIRRLLDDVAGDIRAVERFVVRMNRELEAERAEVKKSRSGSRKILF